MSEYCFSCMRPVEDAAGFCPHCGAPLLLDTPPHQLRPGTLLDQRYEVGAAIGQGGFGITYIGRDAVLDMRVAIKEYFPNGCSTRDSRRSDQVAISDEGDGFFLNGKEKFLREAKILAKFCDEPGIVGVRDYFEANGTAYIVMEYLDGITLKDYITERGPLPMDGVLEMMHPIITALGQIHEQGVIHRDISPDNIILLPDGRPKLLDFGAARELSDGKSLSVLLKLGYAPEEQYRRKGEQGSWTDVYALCATMYFCLTGRAPEESIERLWNGDVNMVRPSEAGAVIQPRQEAALMRGLAVKREDRTGTMGELEAALYPAPGAITLTQFTLGERPKTATREQKSPARQSGGAKTPASSRAKPAASPAQAKAAPKRKKKKRRSRAGVLNTVLIVLAGAMVILFASLLIRDSFIGSAAPSPTRTPSGVAESGDGSNTAEVSFVAQPQANYTSAAGLHLYLDTQELNASKGLSLRVSEGARTVTAVYNGEGAAQVAWSTNNSACLGLTPAGDTMSCTCSPLQTAAGGVTLTVSCSGEVFTIPVYIRA